jgi:hypothetical protein
MPTTLRAVFLMKNNILDDLESIRSLSTTIRLDNDLKPINLYFTDAEKLTCDHIPLISKEHSLLLQTINKLTALDKQRVNHLFVQFFCLVSFEMGLKVIHSTLCFDPHKKSIYLAPSTENLFEAHFLLNFASREKQGYGQVDEVKFHYLSAEDFPDLEIPHSEHLLLNYLNKHEYLTLDFLSGHNIDDFSQIKKIGVILYSCLDSCDSCQNNLLNFFHQHSQFTRQLKRNLDWQVIFFSSVPCKKSSYVASEFGAHTPFKYDKIKKIFHIAHEEEKEVTFPCQISAVEIKRISEKVMLSRIHL